jgi:3-dehydroquinate synthase
MKKIRVKLGDRSYPVLIGEGVLADAGPILRRLGFEGPPVVVTNARVLRLHGEKLLTSLERSFGKIPVIRIGDVERYKNIHTLTRIYEGLFAAHAGRRSWIVALGGGVVGDIAGFAAATYMRGIRYVGVPTTLLAQVDSSVGGKVAINSPRGKNLIGAFHQPSAVLSDTTVLKTLPPRELASGLYEVLKCGAIRSVSLLRYLDRNLDSVLRCEPGPVQHISLAAVRIKANVVAADVEEAHTRMILNFGHTFGHALETATCYRRFKHGEGVAWGMIAAAELSGLSPEESAKLRDLIHRVERLPGLGGISPRQVWQALRLDKKGHEGRIRMVILPRLGQAEISDNFYPARIRAFIKEFLARPV